MEMGWCGSTGLKIVFDLWQRNGIKLYNLVLIRFCGIIQYVKTFVVVFLMQNKEELVFLVKVEPQVILEKIKFNWLWYGLICTPLAWNKLANMAFKTGAFIVIISAQFCLNLETCDLCVKACNFKFNLHLALCHGIAVAAVLQQRQENFLLVYSASMNFTFLLSVMIDY